MGSLMTAAGRALILGDPRPVALNRAPNAMARRPRFEHCASGRKAARAALA
jgi:hypothetical protein